MRPARRNVEGRQDGTLAGGTPRQSPCPSRFGAVFLALPVLLLVGRVILSGPFPISVGSRPQLPRPRLEPRSHPVAIPSSSAGANDATTSLETVSQESDGSGLRVGSLKFSLDWGSPEPAVSKASALLLDGDCFGPCSPGYCDYCGAGNACCRQGWAKDPPECRQVKLFRNKQRHECTTPVVSEYKKAALVLDIAGQPLLSTPAGLWSVGRDLDHGWPTVWDTGTPEYAEYHGPWFVVAGHVSTPQGVWRIRDQWRIDLDGAVESERRWTWEGAAPSPPSLLSVCWIAPAHGNGLLLPGVLYHGNPSARKAVVKGWAEVPVWRGDVGEKLQVEEHRMPQTWVSFEWGSAADGVQSMVALHAQPSAPAYAQRSDVSWTIGAESLLAGTMLQLLSGAVAMNNRTGVTKTGQNQITPFYEVGLVAPPGAHIVKRYRLQALTSTFGVGAGFRAALGMAALHADLSSGSLPRFADIVEAKVRFALSRWSGGTSPRPGFAMFPGHPTIYVMGWAGQAEAPGYALQVLADRLGRPGLREIGRSALTTLADAKFDANGFFLKLDGETGVWSTQDPVSQGQAMSSFARAVSVGRRQGADTKAWETFLGRACELHTNRILGRSWRPQSTAEAFLVQPLALASRLLNGGENFLRAAIKAGRHYVQRHVGRTEPFWGGTLDAHCEDKEGAWAGFEAFLALHQVTGDSMWLESAGYAADMTLTYTYLWDVDLPPGRLRDYGLRTRGWTAVSVQNMHLDVYGVLYTPQLWQLAELTNRPHLRRIAELMYRTCGQMIDVYGSQGEQLQQTRFAQQGDLREPDRFRGGYVEGWTVFWIAAHFLNAAAQFEEMGALGDLWMRS